MFDICSIISSVILGLDSGLFIVVIVMRIFLLRGSWWFFKIRILILFIYKVVFDLFVLIWLSMIVWRNIWWIVLSWWIVLRWCIVLIMIGVIVLIWILIRINVNGIIIVIVVCIGIGICIVIIDIIFSSMVFIDMFDFIDSLSFNNFMWLIYMCY